MNIAFERISISLPDFEQYTTIDPIPGWLLAAHKYGEGVQIKNLAYSQYERRRKLFEKKRTVGAQRSVKRRITVNPTLCSGR